MDSTEGRQVYLWSPMIRFKTWQSGQAAGTPGTADDAESSTC